MSEERVGLEPGIAYLSNGRLFIKRAGEAVREIESAFGRQVLERQTRSQELHGWKGRSGVWGSMGVAPPEFSQWENAGNNGRLPIAIRSVARGNAPDQIAYVLAVGPMGGLFEYDLAEGTERRLMHRDGFQARDLVKHPASGALAMTVAREDGSTTLSISEDDGRYLKHITLTDSVDEAPAWIDGEGKRLVYQAAEIGRDERGYAVGLSPYAIEQVDLEREEVTVVLEDDEADLLQPRLLADGTLYYVRRPYKPMGRQKTDVLAVLTDVVLFPFRLARAVVHFLHVFSVMFSGKPLITAGGPQQQRPENRYLMLWGHMIDTKKALARADREKSGSLVPKEWTLIRRTSTGNEEVIAEGVLAYDVSPAGEVVYTNGSRVLHVDAAGQQHLLCSDRLIEKVIALDS